MDDRVPERTDSHASSSHEPSLEPTFKRREDLCKHSVYTHFPKDRNCEICQRTKITRAPCRRRNSGTVPRADNFGDLITADHKVLSECCVERQLGRSLFGMPARGPSRPLHVWSVLGSPLFFLRLLSSSVGLPATTLSTEPHNSMKLVFTLGRAFNP